MYILHENNATSIMFVKNTCLERMVEKFKYKFIKDVLGFFPNQKKLPSY